VADTEKKSEVAMTDEQRARVEDPDQIDETVPGGKYIQGDRYVNADGEDLGAASKSELKADATPAPQTDEEKDAAEAKALAAAKPVGQQRSGRKNR
jgi:hypothetical protein